ncbi:aldehyde-activating protein [Aliihoeflea aestuarii]|jgi:hypothetical protein|uniref:GFA family protein n=1 Tax=Aliihoeflea aestuarii TaxID=453840 RepID=UPI0020946299|nr:GFA family protein [Aliihoeflea aestuarii]MCO6393036.1 aldehyde-activating protein [Aliihoeflea aestuarii]
MAILATCHCGATKIELPDHPQSVTDCNCTFCERTGAFWAYFPADALRFHAHEGERSYSANGLGKHYFCGNCGMQTWGDAPDFSLLFDDEGKEIPDAPDLNDLPRRHSLNVNLIDDFDWSRVTIEKLDGRKEW